MRSDSGAAVVARWPWLLPFAFLNGASAAAPGKKALTALGEVGERIDKAAAGPASVRVAAKTKKRA
jgi:hypothetical protein